MTITAFIKRSIRGLVRRIENHFAVPFGIDVFGVERRDESG